MNHRNRYKSSFREALHCGLSATIAGRCQYVVLMFAYNIASQKKVHKLRQIQGIYAPLELR
jgi:hypothetical protein